MKVVEILENSSADEYHAKAMSISATDLAPLLHKECSDFVTTYIEAGKFLYRGVREITDDTPFAQGIIRPDRRPLFMGNEEQSLINKAMMNAGAQAHRGNSLFCTGYASTADQWGNIFALFVADGWSGTIFSKISTDEYAFGRLQKTAVDLLSRMNDKLLSERAALVLMEKRLVELGMKTFSSANDLFDVVMAKHNDVLITGQKYYLVQAGYSGKLSTEGRELMLALEKLQ